MPFPLLHLVQHIPVSQSAESRGSRSTYVSPSLAIQSSCSICISHLHTIHLPHSATYPLLETHADFFFPVQSSVRTSSSLSSSRSSNLRPSSGISSAISPWAVPACSTWVVSEHRVLPLGSVVNLFTCSYLIPCSLSVLTYIERYARCYLDIGRGLGYSLCICS